LELWVASRTKNQVQVLDLVSGKELALIDVGHKPVDLVQAGKWIYVVSGGDGRLDVIDTETRTLAEPIALRSDSFPSDIAVIADEDRAYVAAAGTQELFVVNLASRQLEATWPLQFRATAISVAKPVG